MDKTKIIDKTVRFGFFLEEKCVLNEMKFTNYKSMTTIKMIADLRWPLSSEYDFRESVNINHADDDQPTKKHANRFDNDQQADNTNMILQRGFGSLFYTHNDDHNDNHMHGTQQNSRKKFKNRRSVNTFGTAVQ